PRSVRGTDAFPQRPRTGVLQVCDLVNVSPAAARGETAEAFGAWKGQQFVAGGCADVFQQKVVRRRQGKETKQEVRAPAHAPRSAGVRPGALRRATNRASREVVRRIDAVQSRLNFFKSS